MNYSACYHKAIHLLNASSTSLGLLASPENKQNYQRVWARDSAIVGLAALTSNHQKGIDSYKKSVETLAKHQSEFGQIPSNVDLNGKVSYGSIVGRTDSNAWFVVACCAISLATNDASFAEKHHTAIQKTLRLLSTYELNNRGLMYVPISGNWADEYILDGYVLYDQLLRLWALKLYQKAFKTDIFQTKIEQIQQLIADNYWFRNSDTTTYHPGLYNRSKFENVYWLAGFNPARYYNYFDAFANSLAILLLPKKEENKSALLFMEQQLTQSKSKLLPAFSPAITPKDEDWKNLAENYSYEFKNNPHQYHNGGIWPMVNLWVGWAFWKNKKSATTLGILEAINQLNEKENYGFYENFDAITLQFSGTKNQAWSAAATILLEETIKNNNPLFNILFEK